MDKVARMRRDSATVLDRVRALSPEITSRSQEIEESRTVPEVILDGLTAAGAFRMVLDARLGGEEMRLSDACDVIREVARADASVAWHLMVSAGAHVITSRISRGALDTFYAAGPDTWPKAAYSPKGVAVPVPGGYRLSGRWPLASGARAYQWVSVGFLIKDPDGIRMDGDRPDMRICVIPREGTRTIPTWDATGLCGTCSDDIAVDDVFVDEGWQGPFFGPSNLDSPLLNLGLPAATGPYHTAIVLGVLDAALAELAEVSLSKRPAFNPLQLMKDDSVFRSRFGELAIQAHALETLGDEAIRTIERRVDEGRQPDSVETSRLPAAVSHVHQEATRIMNEILLLAGSGSIYRTSNQQRRWRDLRCMAQHVSAGLGWYSDYGAALINHAECQQDAGRERALVH